MPAPLAGVKVLEFTGLGPVPFAASLLADLGACVIAIDRPGSPPGYGDPQRRGRRTLTLDLKHADGVAASLAIARHCDILLEGFRPGVMERLGLGPAEVFAHNRRIIYGRMTGWGQDGPLADRAGHDINYLALSGVLNAIGPAEQPAIPLNLIGDFGGGAMFLLTGVLAALHQVGATGHGTIVDAAMVDGIAALAASVTYKQSTGNWSLDRDSNYLDGASSRYAVYKCADGRFVALGAIEQKFYDVFRRCCGLTDPVFDFSPDAGAWPAQQAALTALFRTRPRDEWTRLCAGHDCCLTPVLDFAEARVDPHAVARAAFAPYGDGVLPAPAPRFSTHALARSAGSPTPITLAEVLSKFAAPEKGANRRN